jgi:aerobic carbon-monoxide dehydrogenase medium subunit
VTLPAFDYVEPGSVEEACALLASDPEGAAVFAGGTDLLVNLRARTVGHRLLVSLRRIADLDRIELGDRGLTISAMVTVNQVARHEEIAHLYPGIADAARSLAAEQVRNQATVVGNLCSAVPSADMAPVLLVRDARLRVVSPSGERTVRLRSFFTGPRRTVLEAGEVAVEVIVPPPAPASGDASLRFGGRESLSLPLASAAALVHMEGEVCRKAFIALGAVAPTPMIATAAGEHLEGHPLTAERLAEAGELAAEASRPIDDVRSSRAYRLELVRVLTRRAVARAAERARGDR